MGDAAQPDKAYTVVVNDEEQYSIWPSRKPVPRGWRAAGKEGPEAECLQYIAAVWTDMRPLSLRRQMDAAPGRSSAAKS